MAVSIPVRFPEQRPFDVVGLGLNSIDHLCVVSEFPRFNTKTSLLDYACEPGGQVATALVALSRWGKRCRYVGTFGDDAAGEQSRGSLAAEGIDLAFAWRRAGVGNQVAAIVVDARSGERTILWRRPVGLAIDPGELTPQAVTAGRLLHLDGTDVEAAIRAASWARAAGIVTAVDIDAVAPRVNELVSLIDLLVVPWEFARSFTGREDPDGALSTLGRTGAAVAAITLGSEGAVATCRGSRVHSPGFEVASVDTTGAGDVFHAGLIYGALEGWSLERALAFANASAALKCTRLGGRRGIPTVAAASALVESVRPSW